MRKISFIHNIISVGYKIDLFNELSEHAKVDGIDFSVLQLAANEKMRENIPVDNRTINHEYTLLFDGCFEKLSFFKKLIGTYRWVKKEQASVYFFPGYFDFSMFLISIYVKYKLKSSVILGVDNNIPPLDNYLKKLVKKFLCSHYDGAISYGSEMNVYLGKLIGSSKPILNGCASVDVNKINDIVPRLNDKKIFIYLGRLSEEKGLRHFEKIGNSISKIQNSKFIIVGDGTKDVKEQYLSKLYNNNSLDFEMIGSKLWPEAMSYLKGSSVLVLPSDYEPWGLVVNEALLCGLKVALSTNVGSKELVEDNQCGAILNFDSITEQELTQTLLNLSLWTDKKEQLKVAANYTSFEVSKRIYNFAKGF